MELGITIIVTIIVIVIIAAFVLIRPKGKRSYSRIVEKEFREQNIEPAPRPVEKPQRAPRMRTGNETSITPLLISVLRAVIGLAAVGVLAYIYISTQDAATAVTDAAGATRIYTEGIFKAVITIGIAAAAYIFTKFQK